MTDNLRMYRLRELPKKTFRLIVFFFLPCVSVFLRLQHRLALVCWNRGQVQDFFAAQFLNWELQLLPKCQWCPGNNHRMCILWNFSYFVHDHRPPREWVENWLLVKMDNFFFAVHSIPWLKKITTDKKLKIIFCSQWNKSFIEKKR